MGGDSIISESGRSLLYSESFWNMSFFLFQMLLEEDSVFSETRSYGTPRVYNLLTDPQERENVLFPHTRVPKAALGQLAEHIKSLKANPPIKSGTKDPYEPQK